MSRLLQSIPVYWSKSSNNSYFRFNPAQFSDLDLALSPDVLAQCLEAPDGLWARQLHLVDTNCRSAPIVGDDIQVPAEETWYTTPPNSSRNPISGPFVWTGEQALEDASWSCDLGDTEVGAIEAAIATFAKTDQPWHAANRANLCLDGLEDLFARIRDELEDGTGLFRLRGFPVERFSLDQIKSFYLAFGEHVGQPVSQSLSGQRLMHIEDVGEKSRDYGVIEAGTSGEDFRSSRSRALSTGGLRFHTDRCDVVSLMCVRQAVKVGTQGLLVCLPSTT